MCVNPLVQTGRPYSQFGSGSVEVTGVTGRGTMPTLRPVTFRQGTAVSPGQAGSFWGCCRRMAPS